jgi:hydrogenase-4 component F
MAEYLLLLLFAAPFAAVVLSFAVRSSRLSECVTVLAAITDLVVSIPLFIQVLSGPVVLARNYIQIDPLGTWVILCISIVYTLASIYAIGYMRLLDEDDRLPLFYGLFSGFTFTMLAACIMNNVGVFWMASIARYSSRTAQSTSPTRGAPTGCWTSSRSRSSMISQCQPKNSRSGT